MFIAWCRVNGQFIEIVFKDFQKCNHISIEISKDFEWPKCQYLSETFGNKDKKSIDQVF